MGVYYSRVLFIQGCLLQCEFRVLHACFYAIVGETGNQKILRGNRLRMLTDEEIG